MFASLIVPAMATRLYPEPKRLVAAYAMGALAYAAGLIGSGGDLPSGAVILWAMALLGLAVYGFGPRKMKEQLA